MHANEPDLDTLLEIRAQLNRLEFTPEVEKKFKAIEAQIARHKRELKNVNSEDGDRAQA